MKKFESTFINMSISIASVVFLLLILEFVIFRYLLVASDMPELDFVNGVIKYRPDQPGIFRVKNEIKSKFNINSNGWNSKYHRYNLKKDKYRIAIIGDSFVTAFQVNYDECFDSILENKLGCGYQVYRFGILGAPLSQYLHMLRQEVITYEPDMVIIILIHNDFDESYKFYPGVYTGCFLKLNLTGDDDIKEIKPIPYQKPWYHLLRRTTTWRYLAYRQQVRFQNLRNLLLGEKIDHNRYQANINITNLDEKQHKNRAVTDYIFRQVKEICAKNNSECLLLMDGDRHSIEKNLDEQQLYQTGALSLNLLAKAIAHKHNIPFIDLHLIFKQDYSNNQKSFSFKCDGHWNSYAHKIVANVIYNYFLEKVNLTKL